MLIAQISDTHITDPGERLAGRIDSAACLERTVACIGTLETPPDCVIATGDLTDRGTPASYALLRRLLAPLAMPVYAIPGNHDRREAMRHAFADCAWMPAAAHSPIRYRVALDPLVLLALDTLVEGEDHGTLGAAQLDWLAAELDAAAQRPVVVMLHHPPLRSGIAVMDAMRLTDGDRLGELIARHPNVERIVCGHLHRSMHARWRGTVVSVPSSPVEQLVLAFDPGAALATTQEPPGFLLHYRSEDGLISHHVPVGTFPGPFP